MSNNHYKLYMESVFALSETLVIKSIESANAINEWVKLYHGEEYVDLNDERTWKYYLNISGEYHFSDEVIYVTSLDTLQSIPFTKQNLTVHTATRAAYQYGSRYYRELVTQYPNLEVVILGVLYPTDINKAIAAEDGAVVGYPAYLVESNEASLIGNIESWIKGFKIRWDNKQFGLSDSYYVAANHAVMYLQMVPLILNLRLAACKTNEAHSFHVRQYLASHGMLDVYLGQMTIKQALFFYRNIAYIERNNGRKEIFSWLTEKVMTDRGLPLAEFTMRHDVAQMPNAFEPIVSFRKKLLNPSPGISSAGSNSVDLRFILDKEEKLTVDGAEYREVHEERIEKLFRRSLSSVVATKVLESSVIDYTDATPYTLQEILLNQWIYLSSHNLYEVYVRVNNPKTGSPIVMTAREAYIYMVYVYFKAIGCTLTNIPKMPANRVQQIPTSSVSYLMEVADSKVIPTTVASTIIGFQPTIPNIVSISDFHTVCVEIHKTTEKQRALTSRQEGHFKQALVRNMVSRMYMDVLCELEAGVVPYADWLSSHNLPSDGFSDSELLLLYKSIYEEATGSLLNTTENLGNLQKAMVKLMEQLSSYSVQFIRDINEAPLRLLNWSAVRVGDSNLGVSDKRFVNVVTPKVVSVDTDTSYLTKVPVMDIGVKVIGDYNPPPLGIIEINVKPGVVLWDARVHKINIGGININHWLVKNDPPNAHKTIGSFERFYDLTPEQQAQIRYLDCNCFETPPDQEHADLGELMLSKTIGKFTYLNLGTRTIEPFESFFIPFKTNYFSTSIEVQELDGLYSGFGKNKVLPFNYSGGRNFLSGMTLDPLAVREMDIDGFKSVYDKYIGNLFTSFYDQTSVSCFVNVADIQRLTIFQSNYGTVNMGGIQSSGGFSIVKGINYIYDEIDLGNGQYFGGDSVFTDFTFSGSGTSFRVDGMNPIFDSSNQVNDVSLEIDFNQ